MKLRSNKFWILLLGAVLVLCAGLAAWLLSRPASQPATGEDDSDHVIAVIRLDGKLVDAVDLSQVEEGKGYLLTFTGESGNTNHVEVDHGRIRVHDATCPDQICVGQGWVDESNSILPIACLPNSLIIEVSTSKELGLDSITK